MVSVLTIGVCLLGILFLWMLFTMPAQGQTAITDGERIALTNEHDMVKHYDEMVQALADFADASDAFAKIHNSGNMWPLKESRQLEVKADVLINAMHKTFASDGWISTRKH